MKTTKILITCALGDYMKSEIDCIKSISDKDIGSIEIYGADMNQQDYPYVDLEMCFKVPKVSDPFYADVIYQICYCLGIDLLIPTHSAELSIFKNLKEKFEKIGTKIMVAGGDIETANDKILLDKAMKSYGIPTPCSEEITTYEDLLVFICSHPEKRFCIKMRNGCGGRGFYIIGDSLYSTGDQTGERFISLESLEPLFEFRPSSYRVQEYLPNDEYTVDMLCVKGKMVAGAVKLNTSVVNGVAENSRIVCCPEAIEICSAIASQLCLDGNVGFDLKRGSDGVLYVIDVNPRLTATISLVVKAGLDLIHLGIRKALGFELPKEIPEAREGIKIHRKLCDVFEKDGELL